MLILSFESSCDETSVAVTRDGKDVLSCATLSQIDIFKNYGGVVPEISSREHVKGITVLIDKALKDASVTLDDIDYIAVTEGPGLIGSLLTGINAAKTIALTRNIPIVGVNHLTGHIYSAAIDHTLSFPALALVISGGHTELIVMNEHYSFEKIGQTMDDAVGESFDKVARILSIPYPGGPLLDKLGREGKRTYNLPSPMVYDKSYNFSFSGLKSAVSLLYEQEKQNGTLREADLARSFEESVCDSLIAKLKKACLEFKPKEIILGGGSAANSLIRERVKAEVPCETVTFPALKYSGDNAAMIGISAYYKILKFGADDISITPNSREDL